MVAYSFNKIFVPQVESGLKTQTVRGHRKRHARVGEPVQIYTAMRTRYCRKLIDPDPVCTRVDEISIWIPEPGPDRQVPAGVEAIEINGVPLDAEAIGAFAFADGFAPIWHPPRKGYGYRPKVTASTLMACFWRATHGPGRFDGVFIQWQPQP